MVAVPPPLARKSPPGKREERREVLEARVTPVRVKIKRLELLAERKMSTTKQSKPRQTSILSYLREEGGEEVRKVLGQIQPVPRQLTSLSIGRCSKGASLGAQRVGRGAQTPRPPKAGPRKVGREPKDQRKEENRGFGPLQKWLTAKSSRIKDPNKVEEDRDRTEEEPRPGPRVQTIREKFEEQGGAVGPKKEGKKK